MRTLSILVLAVSAFRRRFLPARKPSSPPPSSPKFIPGRSTRFADAQVAAASGLKPGDAVTRDQLQPAADRLAQLGIFSMVNYRFTTSGDKAIILEFQLADAPLVPVTFDNFPWFTDEEISAAIRQQLPFFDGSRSQDGALLDVIAAASRICSKLAEFPAPSTTPYWPVPRAMT